MFTLKQRHQSAAVAFEPAGDFKLQQHHAHECAARGPRAGSGHQAKPELDLTARRARPLFWGGLGVQFFVFVGVFLRRVKTGADDRQQHGNDIVRFGKRGGALLDQAIGAFGAGAGFERGARHGKDFAALLKRQPRCDQRTGSLGGFDDDDAKRQTRDQPIAAWKIPLPRLPAERHFGQGQAGAQDLVEKVFVFRRINAVLAACENGHGARRRAGAVRGGIDATRKAGRSGTSHIARASGAR